MPGSWKSAEELQRNRRRRAASVEEIACLKNSRAVASHASLRTGLRVAVNTPDPPILEESLFRQGEDGGKPRRSSLLHLRLDRGWIADPASAIPSRLPLSLAGA